ncbi:MAG: cysteine hydrolase [Peptococcaceae bacterium]|nr:cysteine hydrolase [Peptococcaceae bacterium]
MKNTTRSAMIVIDMERGFTEPSSIHCIRTAMDTVPACSKAMQMAREKGIPVFLVNRIYRADGSDVEATRYHTWVQGGKAMTPGSTGPLSYEMPEGMKPQPGDYTLIKPRFSAFFQTELDLILRRLRVETVILIGTTTPNCIRTSCYDAVSLDYNVVILPECCSSQTEEIQRVNMEDMERVGAKLMSLDEFAAYDSTTCPKLVQDVRDAVELDETNPE